MSLWVKICGNTSLADAQLAVDAGADAVGFVLAPSPRQVTVGEAASICRHLPPMVEKIGVFVNAALEDIYVAVRSSNLTGVQLHFNAAPDLPEMLHQRLGPQLKVLRVVHFEPGFAGPIRELAQDLHTHAILIDSRTATAAGGTGIPFNWVQARTELFGQPGSPRLIAAGGLNPANVADAIRILQPWGVDVVSGVESAPGRKDPIKLREFLTAARSHSTRTEAAAG